MSDVVVTDVLPARVDRVWDVVKDFGGSQRWNPGAVRAIAIEGKGIGAVRTITLPGDAVLQEKLERLDEAARCFSDSITGESPLPLTDYEATIRLSEEGPDNCRIEWSSSFAPAGISEDQARSMVEGIYTGGIVGLKQALAD